MRDEAARHDGASDVTLLDLGKPRAEGPPAGLGGMAAIDEHEHAAVANDAPPLAERDLPAVVDGDVDTDNRIERPVLDGAHVGECVRQLLGRTGREADGDDVALRVL